MIRTSWLGIAGADPIGPRGSDAVRDPHHSRRGQALRARRLRRHRRCSARRTCSIVTTPRRTPARVDGHQRAVAAQRLRAEQCLERVVRPDPPSPSSLSISSRTVRARSPECTAPSTAFLVDDARRTGRSRRPPGTTTSGSGGRTRPAPARRRARRGRPPGSRSMMSSTVTSPRRSANAVCTTAPRAAWPRNRPSTTYHSGHSVWKAMIWNRPPQISRTGERLAQARSDLRRAQPVAGHAPGDRPRDPPAVEREGGDQVEDEHERVDAGQPAEQHERGRDAGRRCAAWPRPRTCSSRPPPCRSRRRAPTTPSVTSGPATATLNSAPGRLGVAGHLRDAAEEPQVDARDLDALPPRDQTAWPELVQDERDEEQQRAGDRGGVGDRVGWSPASCGTSPTG